MKVELNHIHKRFGAVHANNDIHLTFQSGRIIGILGENGAGKSTLMKILSGYYRPDEGEIALDGRRVDYHGVEEAIASGIGMLQQDPLDIAAFTVLENFMYGGKRWSRREARERLGETAARFGFSLDPDDYVSQLSIAGRQQLEIVRLLALGVRLLILDEPTTGISAEQKTILFDTLRQLARDGMTLLLVSHKLEDVIALCDEIAVLRAGRVVGTLAMPATTSQIVQMMFGTEVAPQPRGDYSHVGKADVLSLDNVTLKAGRVTVKEFSLKIRAGEMIGLAGLEGSGQELVLRACAGLVHASHGSVTVNGKNMTHAHYHDFMDNGVAFAAAGRLEEGLIAGLTVTEHIALVTERGAFIDWDKARQHTEAQIQHYRVSGRPDSPIETLSGGNQQRVLMALMPQQPKLLIVEQPTRGLDTDSARWLWEQFLERRRADTAVLFSSPELDEIIAYSDRIIVFYAGRAFEVEDPSSVTIEKLGYLIGGKL